MSLASHTTRDQLAALTTLLLAGAAARLAIFTDVAINGDTGLYLYDAKQLHWGRQLMLDYPSRSPVMEYLLATAIQLGNSPIISARTTMLLIGLFLATAVYAFTRSLHTHRAGLAAAAIMLLTPLPVVWGLWVKTEPVAGLILVTALTLAIHELQKLSIRPHIPAVVGVLFATAFLVRRVAIVHIAAFALFTIYYRHHYHNDTKGTIEAAAIVLTTAAGTLTLAYLLLARFDPGLAYQYAYTHAAALFLSSGQGSLGWIGLDSAKAVTAADPSHPIQHICQKCGLNTIEIFLRTLLVTIPVTLLALVGLRSYLRDGSRFLADVVLPTALTILFLYGALAAYAIDEPNRALGALVFAAGVLIVWLSSPLEFDDWWHPRYALPLTILLTLTAGYLYRDRIIYVTYFQDFYPWLAALTGIIAVEWLDTHRSRLDTTLRRVAIGTAAVFILLATVTAGLHAYPYQPDGINQNSSWHTIESAQATGHDIEHRTHPDDRILTAQPLYVIEADRKIAAHLSRKIYTYRGWPHSAKNTHTTQKLVQIIEVGRAPYAVIDQEVRNLFADHALLEAFQANYCKVPDGGGPEYSRTNGTLYRYTGDTTDCETYSHDYPTTRDR